MTTIDGKGGEWLQTKCLKGDISCLSADAVGAGFKGACLNEREDPTRMPAIDHQAELKAKRVAYLNGYSESA